ncbi:MFS general substrate transporter [Atractiella rhizophila]|nr:MFS general substrate transporter [Atractiella rhizophila]
MSQAQAEVQKDEQLDDVKGEAAPSSPKIPEKQERPYSVYNHREKTLLVALASFGAFFSPLTANIYFPAIPNIANALHKTIQDINLTVTIYQVGQGVAPMFWGTISDTSGRRLMFIANLIVLMLACIGLALTPTSDYWLLLVLRLLQAFGSASTVALSSGVVSDVTEPHERGGFVGLSTLGPMAGPAIGPVISGLLTENLGWRSIFWFLCIFTGAGILILVLFLPETLRAMVDDGSVPPPRLHRPLIPVLLKSDSTRQHDRPPPPKHKTNPFRAFTLFKYPDCVLTLICCGVVTGAMYSILATISPLFEDAYPYLNTTTIGLCFLSIGTGQILGSLYTGKLADRSFQSVKADFIKRQEQDGENPVNMDDFPLEYARFKMMPYYLIIYTGVMLGYGWCIEKRVHLSVTLILHFIFGFVTIGMFNALTIINLDALPGFGSSITACNNLVRCAFSAGTVAFVDPLTTALKPGKAYTVLAGISIVLIVPCCLIIIGIGGKWRKRRRDRDGIVARIR